jgi:hypothetical protein
MQGLNIRTTSQIIKLGIASTILIDCPTATTATATIPSGYFVSTILTNYSISTVPDLYRC